MMLRKHLGAVAIIVLGTITNTHAAAGDGTPWVKNKAFAKPSTQDTGTGTPKPPLPLKPDVQLLEKIANRLVYINNVDWEKQITTTENNIKNLHKEPEGYSKKYSSKDKYVPREVFLHELKQMYQSVNAEKKKIQDIVDAVKSGKEKDLVKAFSDINGVVVLLTKNLAFQAKQIQDRAGRQNSLIEAYNEEDSPKTSQTKESLQSKVKGGVDKLKSRLTGK